MACNSCNSCGNNTYGYRTTNVGGIWFPDFVANSCCNPCCAAEVAGVSTETDCVNRVNGCGCVRPTCSCGCNQNSTCGCSQNNNCGCSQNSNCGCNQNNNCGCGCTRCRG